MGESMTMGLLLSSGRENSKLPQPTGKQDLSSKGAPGQRTQLSLPGGRIPLIRAGTGWYLPALPMHQAKAGWKGRVGLGLPDEGSPPLGAPLMVTGHSLIVLTTHSRPGWTLPQSVDGLRAWHQARSGTSGCATFSHILGASPPLRTRVLLTTRPPATQLLPKPMPTSQHRPGTSPVVGPTATTHLLSAPRAQHPEILMPG